MTRDLLQYLPHSEQHLALREQIQPVVDAYKTDARHHIASKALTNNRDKR